MICLMGRSQMVEPGPTPLCLLSSATAQRGEGCPVEGQAVPA